MCAANVKRQSRGVMLGQADARDGDLGEDVRGGDGAAEVADLGHRPGDAQPPELRRPPVMYGRTVVVDGVAHGVGRFHRSSLPWLSASFRSSTVMKRRSQHSCRAAQPL